MASIPHFSKANIAAILDPPIQIMYVPYIPLKSRLTLTCISTVESDLNRFSTCPYLSLYHLLKTSNQKVISMPIENKKVTRKLSAILSADVKGYSLLMADDEVHTIETLKTYRQIISGLVSNHAGRVVDSPGDNILAEFRSSVDAVECAVKIQRKLEQENSKLTDDKKVQFRIGVNVGDVIQDGDRIYGNGVNVAARIEGLADSGGVCVSRNAYDHVRNKLNLGYEYLGEHSVKNIETPVRVYKLLMAPEDAGKLIGNVPKPATKKWIWATAVLAIIVMTSVVWQFYQKMAEPRTELENVEELLSPLSGKPTVAVLPFVNTSQNSEQEYFSDGITEDIITDLAKVENLHVLSSTTTFSYKEKSATIDEIAKELGAEYVVEGRVRMAGDEVRINAQLIDAKNDRHMWAERYDGKMINIFKLQDQITNKIVASLAVKLTDKEQADISKQDTDNIAAYHAFLKGYDSISRYDPETVYRGILHFEEAVRLDPEYWRAWAALAESYLKVAETTDQLLEKLDIHMVEARLRARYYLDISMKKPSYISYRVAARMAIKLRQIEESIYLAEKAIAIKPNAARSNNVMAMALLAAGKTEQAIDFANRSIESDPGCFF
jgi:adenylate cyclase